MFKNKHAIITATVVIAIVIIGGALIHSRQPVSLLADVKYATSGYNDNGSIDVTNGLDTKGKIRDEVIELAGKREKLSKAQITSLQNGDENGVSPSTIDAIDKDYRNISIDFNKSTLLKNGDKVSLYIKDKNAKPLVKSEKKTVTVKGLEKTKTISTNQILKQVKVQAIGFNGKGTLTAYYVSKRGLPAIKIKASKFKNLKNNDTVDLKISLRNSEDGIIFKGSHKKSLKINHLLNLAQITNTKAAETTVYKTVYANQKGNYAGPGAFKLTAHQYFIKPITHTYMKSSGKFGTETSNYLSIKSHPTHATVAIGLLSNSNLDEGEDDNYSFDEYTFHVNSNGKIMISKKLSDSSAFEDSGFGSGSEYAKDVIKNNKQFELN
ncbi:hypothetical protein N6G95_08615 [Pediococcus inopinatus]|uniref:hypothetical protein n=1 Tax=Pediococcus inopinatus TaxID=114090 RepID=UPI002B25DFAA|nr:hypothetical protein [Pediococcus inopinatus]WPC19284.1 hypothetical protein N6G95_08615 [Pediococcus inopinatus]